MILKNKYFNYFWNAMIAIITSALAIVVPFDLVFQIYPEELFLYVNILVTTVFTLDIFYNIYKSMYLSADEYVLEEFQSLSQYLKRWFLVDLIAALPLSYMLDLHLAELGTLIKMLKTAQFMSYVKHREIKYWSELTLFFFAYWISHIAHWISCGWLLIRGIDTNLDMMSNYIKAIYWTTTTLTTVGYGDIIPNGNSQMIYASFTQLMGIGVYGYLIGNVANILSRADPAKGQYLENIEKLSALIRHRDLPKHLQRRLRDFYAYIWKKKWGYDEDEFLEQLPRSLRIEVNMHLKREIVENIPLFKGANLDFVQEITMRLKPVIISKGDYVFKAGEKADSMYFIVHGEIWVLNREEDKILAKLGDGDFFGEVALYRNDRRNATILSKSFSDLYVLDRDAFDYVLTQHPDIAQQIAEKVAQRTGN